MVVPAYNEESHISKVLETIPRLVDMIIPVDDCSTDSTWKLIEDLSRHDERVRPIKRATNGGVGAAIVTGHKQALCLGADLIVVMAGDGQMDPAYLKPLLDPLFEGFHFSKGNRFLGIGSLTGMPKHRVFGNVIITLLEKASSGYWHIYDPMNGYTAIKREALEKLPLDRLSGLEHIFELGALNYLGMIGFRVKDVDIPARYRDELSQLRIRRVVRLALPLFIRGFIERIYRRYIVRDFHPCAIMLFFGLPLFLWGLIYGGVVFVQRILGLIESPSTATVMFSVLPLILGLQFLLTGLQMDITESRTYS